MSAPRVSVVIPNFNNGRASSLGGQRDMLGALLASLERTLDADRALLEIVIADDGSTDESLATARTWAERRRPDGRAFLRIIELEHSGVLSRVLNRLLAEAKGDIIARLDGDVVLQTNRWASELVAIFDRDERIGVVTGVQLRPDGIVHAFGDDLWGPRGYRHIAHGARLGDLPKEREVDHAMGCFYATRRAVHTTVGDYDLEVLRGQTEEYGVRVRLAGWKVVATSRIAFEHWHVGRAPRANRADSAASLDGSLLRFAAKCGFDRLAPDLAHIRARYANTPLWWRDHASRGVPAAADDWLRLTREPHFSEQIAEEFDFASTALRSASAPCPLTQIGAGCGCLGATIARAGGAYEGFEETGPAVAAAIASQALARAAIPPRFIAVEDLARLPLPSTSRPIVCLFATLERYWNPVGLMRECLRVLAPGGVLCVRTALRQSPLDEPSASGHPFTADEFLAFVRHLGGTQTVGFAPRVTASGWLECCLGHADVQSGRGYFGGSTAPSVGMSVALSSIV
ncbi:MAG: glycosyltransferase [Phycisphaerae bacterium]|nr:glycosyltransferase [Phycisphaerae bacterium]